MNRIKTYTVEITRKSGSKDVEEVVAHSEAEAMKRIAKAVGPCTVKVLAIAAGATHQIDASTPSALRPAPNIEPQVIKVPFKRK